MIEIKPVAYAPREDWSRFDSESRLFPLWEVEQDAANLGYYEPLYDQQSIDSLRAEVWRLRRELQKAPKCCANCEGRGITGKRDICPSCGGTGRVRV